MINYPQRLIEVDLPIKRISAHARREKSIRHGHISTLHIWWARRPLAACRAVICAALWPDPADPLCPQAFRDATAAVLARFASQVTADKELANSCPETFSKWMALKSAVPLNPADAQHWVTMRGLLLDFIADFANWDNSAREAYLEVSRILTLAAHEALGGLPGTQPLVVDPFAGGGAIPLEALRVGADAFASDLNPVAVLLNKVVLEYVPKYGRRLADEVRKWGQWIKEQAESELAEFYPKDPDGATPIAYLWTRTITCEGPGCGAEVPLMRSLWLAKKGSKSVALRLVPNRETKWVDFEIINGAKTKDVGEGTVRRGSATCPVCGFTTSVDSVRKQLARRGGGANDARMVSVVAYSASGREKFYRLPREYDESAVVHAREELACRKSVQSQSNSLSLVPDESLDIRGIRHTWVMTYGFHTWDCFYTQRQGLALSTFCRLVATLPLETNDGLDGAIRTCLALAVDRGADYWSSLALWAGDFVAHTFARQALPFVSDFAEAVPIADASGNWDGAVDWIARVIDHETVGSPGEGHAMRASASAHPLPDDSCQAYITDPPYYDAVPYAYLSDYFYMWLKRSIGHLHPDLFRNNAVPKEEEIVVDRPHQLSNSHKDIAFYESNLAAAFTNGRRMLAPNGIAIIVFASKTTASWEAVLRAIVESGWVVTGSWPIDTERQGRVSAVDQARLQSSIHIVCRPREDADGSLRVSEVGDWRDVLAELPRRIHEWMPRLATEGVVGADAIFACLGPALEIFSRYSRVERASGEQVTLREYLEYVWAAMAREALNMIFDGADTTGFEEDSRLTAIWFWVIKEAANGKTVSQEISTTTADISDEEGDEATANTKAVKGYVMEFDAVRKLAQGLGADLLKLSRPGGIITIQGNLAKLNYVSQRERLLLGVQMSLFGEQTTFKQSRQYDMIPKASLKEIRQREASLFEEPVVSVPNYDQPVLPFINDMTRRSLIDRLLS